MKQELTFCSYKIKPRENNDMQSSKTHKQINVCNLLDEKN